MISLEVHTETKAEYWKNERGSGILSHGRSRIGSQIKKSDLEKMRQMVGENGYPFVFWWNGKTKDDSGVNLSLPAGEGWRVTEAGKEHLKSIGYELKEV
jgi:hypothetical protein